MSSYPAAARRLLKLQLGEEMRRIGGWAYGSCLMVVWCYRFVLLFVLLYWFVLSSFVFSSPRCSARRVQLHCIVRRLFGGAAAVTMGGNNGRHTPTNKHNTTQHKQTTKEAHSDRKKGTMRRGVCAWPCSLRSKLACEIKLARLKCV